VVIEDYVHSGAKLAAVIAIQLCCYGFAVIGIIAVLRVALRN
jgi:succinate dehydrogenase / fumarate reductase membrane anchor subunit